MNSLGKFLGKRQMPSSGLVKSSRAGLGGEAGRPAGRWVCPLSGEKLGCLGPQVYTEGMSGVWPADGPLPPDAWPRQSPAMPWAFRDSSPACPFLCQGHRCPGSSEAGGGVGEAMLGTCPGGWC